MGFSLIVAPYWSAFTDAYIRKDFNWIRNVVKKTLKIWYFYAFIGILMLLFSPFIYNLWIKDRLSIPPLLSVSMLIFSLLISYGSIFVMFINGTGKVKLQTYFSLFSPLIFLGFAFVFTHILKFGISGIVIATIISNLYGPIIAPIQFYKIIKR